MSRSCRKLLTRSMFGSGRVESSRAGKQVPRLTGWFVLQETTDDDPESRIGSSAEEDP